MYYSSIDPDLNLLSYNDHHGIFTLEELNDLAIVVKPHLSSSHLKCILNQLVFYFTMEDFIIRNQYGFRQGRTTTDCLVDPLNEITTALDNNIYVLTFFLDLRKAFDTVNHSVLLSKLAFYGIEDVEYQWLRSYLQNRKQRVLVSFCVWSSF